MADVAPGGGRHPQDVARLLRQRLDPDHQRVAEGRRDLGALGRRREQLLGEERVAVGALEHVPDQRLARLLAEDRDQESAELLARKRSQVDPLDDGSAIELRHERPQGVATMKLVAAVGADEQQPRVVRVANQEGEEVPGRSIGPVQVLDREHDRSGLAEAGEQREQDLEQARLCERLVEGRVAADPALAGVAELGSSRASSSRPGRASSSAGPSSRARGRSAAVSGAKGSSPSASSMQSPASTRASGGRRMALELGDQPGLADPGLAGDQDRAEVPRRGSLEGAGERGQLLACVRSVPGSRPVSPRTDYRGPWRGPGTSRARSGRRARSSRGGGGPGRPTPPVVTDDPGETAGVLAARRPGGGRSAVRVGRGGGNRPGGPGWPRMRCSRSSRSLRRYGNESTAKAPARTSGDRPFEPLRALTPCPRTPYPPASRAPGCRTSAGSGR